MTIEDLSAFLLSFPHTKTDMLDTKIGSAFSAKPGFAYRSVTFGVRTEVGDMDESRLLNYIYRYIKDWWESCNIRTIRELPVIYPCDSVHDVWIRKIYHERDKTAGDEPAPNIDFLVFYMRLAGDKPIPEKVLLRLLKPELEYSKLVYFSEIGFRL